MSEQPQKANLALLKGCRLVRSRDNFIDIMQKTVQGSNIQYRVKWRIKERVRCTWHHRKDLSIIRDKVEAFDSKACFRQNKSSAKKTVKPFNPFQKNKQIKKETNSDKESNQDKKSKKNKENKERKERKEKKEAEEIKEIKKEIEELNEGQEDKQKQWQRNVDVFSISSGDSNPSQKDYVMVEESSEGVEYQITNAQKLNQLRRQQKQQQQQEKQQHQKQQPHKLQQHTNSSSLSSPDKPESTPFVIRINSLPYPYQLKKVISARKDPKTTQLVFLVKLADGKEKEFLHTEMKAIHEHLLVEFYEERIAWK